MRIIEKGCDPSIKLAKFKFNCDECDKSIPNPLPQNLNHFMLDDLIVLKILLLLWILGEFRCLFWFHFVPCLDNFYNV